MKYTLQDFANMIDHALVSQNPRKEDLLRFCDEAHKYNFKIVAINSAHTEMCVKHLEGKNTGVGSSVSFPFGQMTLNMKLKETQEAIDLGAKEIDYVINLSDVYAKDYDLVKEEMTQMTEICHKHKVLCKVILETSELSDEEIVEVCKIAKDVKIDFIKTSSGYASHGAKLEHVRLMKSVVKNEVGIKASGGIRDAKTFLDMIRAGATRIGTSSGIKILEELKAMMNGKDELIVED